VEEAEREAAAARVVDEDEGEELCNCEFSLAYGAKILLNNATMRLLRGHRYGLCGPNGVGKSTLMRAIANGQVDGFPPADELRTVYVEHDIQASHADLTVVDFVFVDPLLHSGGLDVTREEIEAQLTSIGFTQEMLEMVITSLSGGWKMKLALARCGCVWMGRGWWRAAGREWLCRQLEERVRQQYRQQQQNPIHPDPPTYHPTQHPSQGYAHEGRHPAPG